MTGVLRLTLERAREAIVGPVGLAFGAWLVLAMIGLPAVGDIALSGGDRAVSDIGLLGLRLAMGVAAIALGASAVGPPLRSGEIELWRARGLRLEVWLGARGVGSLVPLGLGLVVGVGVWLGLASALGAGPVGDLAAWTVLAVLEGLVVWGVVTATSTALRGPVGPLVGLVWLAAGRLADTVGDPPGLAGWVTDALGVVAPRLVILDGQAALLGSGPTPDLAVAVGYAALWLGIGALLTWLAARRVAER